MNTLNNVLIYGSPLIIWGALALIDYITEARTKPVTDDPCGYCGDSDDPNDMCYPCYHALSAPEEVVNNHTPMCHEYWDRGLNCQCIDDGVKAALRNGANPEDVM